MRKKWIILSVILLTVIAACWLVGRKLYPDGPAWRQTSEAQQTISDQSQPQTENVQQETALADVSILKRSVAFENAGTTGDNPWGLTAGVVNADGYCIFLTPQTGAAVSLFADEEKPVFELEIHPQMVSASDGVGVTVLLLDDEGRTLLEKEELIQGDTVSFAPDWSAYTDCRKIVFRCNSGTQGNSDADWLLIRESSEL